MKQKDHCIVLHCIVLYCIELNSTQEKEGEGGAHALKEHHQQKGVQDKRSSVVQEEGQGTQRSSCSCTSGFSTGSTDEPGIRS